MSEIEQGLKVVQEMLGDENVKSMKGLLGSGRFGGERAEVALEFVFGKIWSRPGLDRRARSLVTMGILIGLGQTQELKFHVLAAVRNGLSAKEIEEVLYQSIPYAGFPRATQATEAAAEVLRQLKLIE